MLPPGCQFSALASELLRVGEAENMQVVKGRVCFHLLSTAGARGPASMSPGLLLGTLHCLPLTPGAGHEKLHCSRKLGSGKPCTRSLPRDHAGPGCRSLSSAGLSTLCWKAPLACKKKKTPFTGQAVAPCGNIKAVPLVVYQENEWVCLQS